MFNLEQATSEWRRKMQAARLKNSDIVDDLESHLREDWAQRVQSGESEEKAFEGAVQALARRACSNTSSENSAEKSGRGSSRASFSCAIRLGGVAV